MNGFTYANFCNLYHTPTIEAEYYYKIRTDLNLKFVTGGNKIEYPNAIKDRYEDMNFHLNEMTTFLTIDDLMGNGSIEEDKELSKLDYIGICHYRMFFDCMPDLDGSVDLYVAEPYNMKQFTIFGFKGDTAYGVKSNIKSGYIICHLIKYWNLFESHFTPIYGRRFKDWYEQQSMNAPCNLFIAKRNVFRDYMDFYKTHIGSFISAYDRADFKGDGYQERQLAFLSERMFSFWCYLQKDRLNIKELKASKHRDLGKTVDRK